MQRLVQIADEVQQKAQRVSLHERVGRRGEGSKLRGNRLDDAVAAWTVPVLV